MENSKIEWTDHTLNLWWGCMKVHTGCKNCYAETLDNRYNHDNPHWGPNTSRMAIKSSWKNLDKFQRDAAKEGVVKRVFVGSMMDIFEEGLPVVDDKHNPIELDNPGSVLYTSDLRDTFFGNISRGQYPNLYFLLLTKRPENINKFIPESWKVKPPANVLFGTSVVDQETADKMVPEILKVNGKRFLSCEPLLGTIDLTNILISDLGARINALSGKWVGFEDTWCPERIDWVICGGESGPKSRPMHPDWARSLREQCRQSGVPYFFKQWGEYVPEQLATSNGPFFIWTHLNPKFYYVRPDGKCCEYDDYEIELNHDESYWMAKVGKHEAGALLDGQEHKNFPMVPVFDN